MNFSKPSRSIRMTTSKLLSAFSLGLLIAGASNFPSRAMGGETFTDAAEAGQIYKLQGEYLGVLDEWGGNWGAQVIAKSKTKLEVHLLKGGLPGEGFKGKEPTKSFSIEWVPGKENATGSHESVDYVLKPETLALKTKPEAEGKEGKKLGVLTKVVRESKTLGMKPPADAKILFGNDVNDFQNAKKIGDLLGVGGTSKETFGDHRIHLEFRLPFQPEDSGQGRGNSGVYVQGRYEVQVLDSFGLRGEDNECGGIYQISRPSQNMCYPPLTWQTYDIEFTAAKFGGDGKKVSNAKITVRHNGVVIHEDRELPRHTPGKNAEGPDAGPLYLQDHGNPVVYRNIWVQSVETKPANAGPAASASVIE